MKLKTVCLIVVSIILMFSMTLTSFAANKRAKYATVSYNVVSISGDKTGIEIVKTSRSKVRFEFLNVDNASQYTTTAKVKNGVMTISIIKKGARPENISVASDNYKNTVRVYVPYAQYRKFKINADGILVKMPDYPAMVNITGGRQGGIYLEDNVISKGTYNIDFDTSYIDITANKIKSDITVKQANGQVSLNFGKKPESLYLDTTNCFGIVELPRGWPNIYKVGKSHSQVTISNCGATYVTIK